MKKKNKKSLSLRSKRKNLLRNETILTTDSGDSRIEESNKHGKVKYYNVNVLQNKKVNDCCIMFNFI